MKEASPSNPDFIQNLSHEINNHNGQLIIVWALNDRLCKEQMEQQLGSFKSSGYEGVMVMPWGGLPYEFMCDEWLDSVRFILQAAQKLSLDIWIWDDWIFGSGPAGGQLTEERAYRAKELKLKLDFIVEPGETTPFILPPRTVSAKIFSVNKFGHPTDHVFETISLDQETPITITAESRKRVMVLGWEYRSGIQHSVSSHSEFLNQDISEEDCDIRISDDKKVWSIDMMNQEAVSRYVELIHQRYWEAMPGYFGNTLKGFFYDEPKVSSETPWTEDFAKRFAELKGYDLTPYMIPMMLTYKIDGGCFKERFTPADVKRALADYKDVWTTLVAETFYKTIQVWCGKHGVQATGHPNGDNHLKELFSNGGMYLKNMAYSDMPGIDTIFGQIAPGEFCDCPRFAGSRAALLGKSRAMSETFAVYGHGLDLDQMRYVCEHQIMRGVNTFFCKLSNYNREKSLYFHPPELSDYNPIIKRFGSNWAERISNISSLMSSGNPAGTGVALYIGVSNYYAGEPNIADATTEIAKELTYNQTEFDYIWDQDIMCMQTQNNMISAKSGKLYKCIIIPPDSITPPDVREKLDSLAMENTICELGDQTVQNVIAMCRKHDSKIFFSDSTNTPVSVRTREIQDGIQCCMLLNESSNNEQLRLRFIEKSTVFELDLNTWQTKPIMAANAEASLEIDFTPSESRLFIFDSKNEFKPQANIGHSPSNTISLKDWTVDTPDKKTIALGQKLPDWATLGHPGYTGTMRYNSKFTLKEDVPEALLSLGRLCYAATIFLDGEKVGDCLFSPFRLQLKELKKGTHSLEIDVLNTLANSIYGDTKRLEKLRISGALKGTYAPIYEKIDAPKLKSGLFGPVTLHLPKNIGAR